jgi:hypothetical protein
VDSCGLVERLEERLGIEAVVGREIDLACSDKRDVGGVIDTLVSVLNDHGIHNRFSADLLNESRVFVDWRRCSRVIIVVASHNHNISASGLSHN